MPRLVSPVRRPGWAAAVVGLFALVAAGESVGQDPPRPPGRLPGRPPQPGQPVQPVDPAQPGVVPAPVVPPAPGMPPAAGVQPADRAAINRAIDAGVKYLQTVQNPNGSWESKAPGGERWVVGYTALAGLTLIECGVPVTDPGIQKAAEGVRRSVYPYPSPNPKVKQDVLDDTYEVSLAILFLDRVGDRKDDRLIQVLATRLIAGQAGSGGWGYKVPRMSESDAKVLLPAIRKLSPPAEPNTPSHRERPSRLGLCIKASDDLSGKAAPPYDPAKARKDALATPGLTPAMKAWPVFQEADQFQPTADPPDRRSQVVAPTTDNSNTHFAMLALWAARKHDVPADRSLTLLARRFRASNKGSGGWEYNFVRGGGEKATPSMTSVALMGVAIGHVIDPDARLKPEDDPLVLGAFRWLSRYIGEPAGRIDGRPAPKDARGLYFLWAVERVAVLYDVAKLAQKDWYLWGAEILLGHQNPADGSWSEEGGYHGQHPILNTCFALLFLKRANLTPDLSRRLVIDTTALTEKVDSKPDTSPIVPEPPPEPSEIAEEIPPPREKEEAPAATTPVRTAAEPTVEAPTTTPEKKKGFPWGWIVLGLVVAVGLGFCLFLLLTRKKEEEKPKKKKKKLKAKAAD
ncbi:MAG: hypothetical protein C0501_04820 [Isosphaera sp.]|nr:hypothetical protein [Isosphaera sp.]